MTEKNRYFFIGMIILLLFSNQDAISQRADTIIHYLGKEQILHKDTLGNVYYPNALQYSLQKRYLAQHHDFENRNWYDNLHVGLAVGLEQILPAGGRHFNTGRSVTLSASKALTPEHSLRALFSYSTASHQHNHFMIDCYQFKADYLFNISSYFAGYDALRKWQIITFAGAGAVYSRFASANDKSVQANWGVQLQRRTGNTARLFVEPYVTLSSDGVDISQLKNYHKYDVLFGTRFGINYDLSAIIKENRNSSSNNASDSDKKKFLELSTGISMLGNGYAAQLRNVGNSYQIAFGRWLDPVIGFRLSGMIEMPRWKEKKDYLQNDLSQFDQTVSYKCSLFAAYLGARMEAIFNLLPLIGNTNVQNPFQLNVTAGLELGRMVKCDEKRLECGYHGFCGGVSLLYRLTNNLSLFCEPHITLAEYSIPYQNKPGINDFYPAEERLTDNRYSLLLGIRMSPPCTDCRSYESSKNFYRNHFFAGIEGGYIQAPQQQKIQEGYQLNAQVGLFAGCSWSPLQSARLSVSHLNIGKHELTRVRNTDNSGRLQTTNSVVYSLQRTQYQMLRISTDYMLNLSQLYASSSGTRWMDIELFAGPSLFIHLKEKHFQSGNNMGIASSKHPYKDNVGMGMQAGFNVSASISPRFALFFSPQVSITGYDFMGSLSLTSKLGVMTSYLGGIYYRF